MKQTQHSQQAQQMTAQHDLFPAQAAEHTARTRTRTTTRTAVVGAGALTAFGLLCAPAFAHVSVNPEGAAVKGEYATVNFKVPNERDNASTTKVEVNLPAEHPLVSVMPQPVPGWKAEVTRSKLDKPIELHGKKIDEAVTKVTWTADGKGVEPGYFQKFPLSIGQLPKDTDELVFKAIQTYSNKEVVRWIEAPQEGQEEPEHPAPVLELSDADDADDADDAGDGQGTDKNDKADDDSDGMDGAGQSGGDKATAEVADDDSDGGSDTTARVLAVVGILVGAAGVAFGVFAGRRRTG